LNSWKRSTSYKQRWQIKLGSGSLADTCNRHYGGKTVSDNAWLVLRLFINASNCMNCILFNEWERRTEWMVGKVLKESSWFILRYYISMCLDKQKKTIKHTTCCHFLSLLSYAVISQTI
jgi:hypothetical protein